MTDEDMLHAYAHPIRVFQVEDGLSVIIGANQAATVFGVGVVDGVEAPVIVHPMRARETFLR